MIHQYQAILYRNKCPWNFCLFCIPFFSFCSENKINWIGDGGIYFDSFSLSQYIYQPTSCLMCSKFIFIFSWLNELTVGLFSFSILLYHVIYHPMMASINQSRTLVSVRGRKRTFRNSTLHAIVPLRVLACPVWLHCTPKWVYLFWEAIYMYKHRCDYSVGVG
jgi:hypothetical protein